MAAHHGACPRHRYCQQDGRILHCKPYETVFLNEDMQEMHVKLVFLVG